MTAAALIHSYYDSLARKDDTWQALYAEDAVFADASQTLHATGRNAVVQSFLPFLRGVEGVRVKQLIVDGDAACAIVGYEYTNAQGAKLQQDVAEVWQVKGDTLAKLTIYFDLTAYRNFMRG